MAIHCYLPPCEVAEKFESLITDCLSLENIAIYHDIDTFSRQIRFAFSDVIGVILVRTQPELDEILLLSDFLWSIRTILILPDSDRETVVRGHAMRPRFLTSQDRDLSEVMKVLQKMTNTRVVPIK